MKEKGELEEFVKETEDKLREKEEEHENEVQQMDDQLEQTRQVIESIKSDCVKKVADLEESLRAAKERFKRELELKEKDHEDHVMNMEKVQEELQVELGQEKSDSVSVKKQLETLVRETEVLARERTENSFEQPPFVEENVVASENWMETQAFQGKSEIILVRYVKYLWYHNTCRYFAYS